MMARATTTSIKLTNKDGHEQTCKPQFHKEIAMLRVHRLVGVMFLVAIQSGAAQRIAPTVQVAESEGAALGRIPDPTVTQSAFAHHRFGGTDKRRCVSSDSGVAPDGSRSGELIVRNGFDFGANVDHKILWMPLHLPADRRTPLLIRAALIGHPADSLRLQVSNWATAGVSHEQFGYPSLIRFPTVGTWLVVATTGPDWGCFLVTVAP
jgi:hypothetical protein